ncbi:MAG: CehA/McbA family metallohydrolase [Chloroflexi bacterium]|nr:CehA/McbA family metallohydrolase [Chloroflexota bacterium]
MKRISRRQCLLGSAALAAGSLLLSCWRAVSPGQKPAADVQANPFAAPGQWYKGAVHVHSTRSDGKLSPEEVMKAHRERGYDFLALTDHNVITDLSALSDKTFLNIPSVEWTYDRNELGQSYHIVVLGVRQNLTLSHETPIQEAIDAWAAAGATIFVAHTYWSGMVYSELLPLDKLIGLEVYNTSSMTDHGKGLAAVHWDDVLVRGKRWWGLAVDDTHWISEPGRPYYDTFGGWVMVKSQKLDEASILAALRQGQFYSSSGPEILDYRIENGVAYLKCSPAQVINFVGHTQWGTQRRAAPGQTVTEAEYRLNGKERYLRGECMDAEGNKAWTNPIYLS